MAVSIMPLAFLYKKYKFLIVGCIPNALANTIAAILETFAHGWYINTPQTAGVLTTVPMLIVGVYLLVRYSLSKSSDTVSLLS